jgi:UDP-glucose 4-epimerase
VVLRALTGEAGRLRHVVALDVRPPSDKETIEGVTYRTGDVRSAGLADVLREFAVTSVVHLASIVNPGKHADRSYLYSVDVEGTENVLACCIDAGVGQIVVASSGAAYGYYPDNPVPLREDDPLRGNPEFAYSDHKRIVEEMLARYREEHPELRQLILRPGTILGESTSNQITRLFEGRIVLGLRGTTTPFVFAWDQDVAACIVRGILDSKSGIYNLAGDGTLTMREIAKLLGKPYVALPAPALASALWLLRKFNLTQYGPEHVNFLRYRPVLSNELLKREFPYTPRKTSEETFRFWLDHKQLPK